MSGKELIILNTIAILSIVILIALYIHLPFANTIQKIRTNNTPKLTPTPTKEPPFGEYMPPNISHKPYYKIAMVGDSMTYALGIHGGKLSEYLNTLYKSTLGNQRIVMDNYAVGSKNILYLKTELTTPKTDSGETLQPITTTHPDLILIESFGYNPLSQLGLINGQKKQTETLDEIMKYLTKQLPHTAIMFVATIAPNKETYAQNENPGSQVSDREQQAEERIAYIKNHMEYANTHKIPLIDIYDKSLTASDDGNLIYINPSDHIHPSFAGIDFIDHQIGDFIYASKVLPQ